MRKANLNRLEYFIAIAETGTITGAADQMRISKSVVSKQLRLLEKDLGSALVVRTSRHLHLTEIGQSFYQAARAAVAQADQAYEMVRQGNDEPSGTLRVTAPIDFGTDHVVPVTIAFQKQHPAVKIELSLSDTQFNPVDAQFDIALRVGWLKDSANIARKISGFQQYVVAAPQLVEQYGTPKSPADLKAFPFIEHRALPSPLQWKFHHQTSNETIVEMHSMLSANETPAIKSLALGGGGISILPSFYVDEELKQGTLVKLLPDWQLTEGGIYAVYPPTQFRSAATQRFAEMLAAALKKY